MLTKNFLSRRAKMRVLYHPDCLLHRTVELLGAKIIPALECPERLDSVIVALKETDGHELVIENYPTWESDEDIEWSEDNLIKWILKDTHDAGYLNHLMTVHKTWVTGDLIKEDEHVLPECFRIPSVASGSSTGDDPPLERPPPKDIYAKAGYYAFDMSTGIAKDTWTSTLASANLAVRAATYVMSPGARASSVIALCRPPGHHCTSKLAGGYCYVNNAVVAVEAIRRRKRSITTPPERHGPDLSTTGPSCQPNIAILDLDFHHGNGTQDVFYHDPSVLYVSIHGRDEYPYYTGSESETGAGAGKGYNLNLPLPAGSSISQYLEKLEMAVERLVEFEPEYLIVSLGFDTFHLDPLGGFKIDVEDYDDIARRIKGEERLKSVPGMILLEGGYVVEKLGECIVSFVRGWEGGVKSG